MGLISHLCNCSVVFAIYFHVHYNYKANEIIYNILGLFNQIHFLNFLKKLLKNYSITHSDIIEQVLNTKKIISLKY